MPFFAGIEGGASMSKALLVDGTGKELAWVEGPSTNYLLVGKEETQLRIKNLIDSARAAASLGEDAQIEALGLCLSGCECEENNVEFSASLLKRFPNLSNTCFALSDTLGSIMTASPDGGAVLIAGTGSNSILLNPDGQVTKAGGWGHMLGDEGSAYSIAHNAMKRLIDHDDNLAKSEHSVDSVRRTVYEYFEVTDNYGLLRPLYTAFDKTHFAGLAAKLAALASSGDVLACQVFYEAGVDLGRHVAAWIHKVHPSLMSAAGGLKVVCVGSVFKSWPLLKQGFFSTLSGHELRELTLLRLKKPSAFGAALMAAHKSGHLGIDINYEENYETLCHYLCD